MSGFGFSTTTDEVLEGIDLSGTRALITGASTGLGEETARALASHGAAVTMTARTRDKGEAAADRIRAAHPEAELEVRTLELGDLASVRALADGVLSDHPRLDLLVNNAGVMACPQGTTTDGFELQMGTNHLGHFLLANLLSPALVAAAPARVVALSSAGHRFSAVDLDDPWFERTPYDPWVAYGRAKTANALFALGWDQRFGADGVHGFSVHPGGIITELGRHLTDETIATLMGSMPDDQPLEWKTVPQGAATTCWAATAPDLVDHGGAYLEDCQVAEPTESPDSRTGVRPYAVDPTLADELWAWSEGQVGLA